MIKGIAPTGGASLLTAFEKARLGIFQTLNCVKIGRITAFDAVKRTASVEITFVRPLVDGTTETYPELQDCPVFTLQGGGGALTFPIRVGDECLVLFSDSNIDAWYSTGLPSVPYDGRRHDISDAIALVGLNSLAKPLSPAVTASEVSLDYSGAKIAEKNGKIALSNATADFLTAMDVFLASLGGSADPTVAAAAPILKTKIDALFYKGI